MSGLIELPELVLLFDPTADPEQLKGEEAQRSLSKNRLMLLDLPT